MINNFLIYFQKDLNLFLISIFFVSIVIFLSEFFFKHYKLKSNIIRKLVHILVGVAASFTPFFFNSNLPQIFIALTFISINYLAINNNFLISIHSIERKSYGTTFFSVSFLILSVFFWEYKSFFLLSFMMLSLSDPLASMVGENCKNPKIFYVLGDRKSIEGSITFFVVSIIILFIGSSILLTLSLPSKIFFSIFIAIGATIAEISSSKGSDNISIPIVSILLMIAYEYRFKYVNHVYDIIYSEIFILFIIMIALLFITHKIKLLSFSGFLGATLMGTFLIMFKSISYILLFIIFFIFSSLISKIFKKEDFYNTKGSKRDLIQVYSNGGAALLICIYDYFSPSAFNILLFSSSIAAAMADTWGTEFGKISKSKPKSIISMKSVNHGESGGITLIGTFASLLGSCIIGFSTYFLFRISIYEVVLIILSGFIAALIDSILGATLQGKFKLLKTNKIIEENQKDTIHISGLKWMTNDLVNLANTFISPFIFITFHLILS